MRNKRFCENHAYGEFTPFEDMIKATKWFYMPDHFYPEWPIGARIFAYCDECTERLVPQYVIELTYDEFLVYEIVSS